MFKPKTERLENLFKAYPEKLDELERVFAMPTNVYIDFANVRGWSHKLNWHVDIRRLKQLLDSFDTVRDIKFYHGTLKGKLESEIILSTARKLGYIVRTKPVKTIRLPIDVSSIAPASTDILKDFIHPALLPKLKIDTISSLNDEIKDLNRRGILHVEELKANFDVEIGRDMLRDYDTKEIDHFVLWSGDSDFEDPIRQLLRDNKRVTICATARRIATELNVLRAEGLAIFDIQKIREFICYKKEMAKGTSCEAPKHR